MKKLNTFFFTFFLTLSLINGNAQVCTTPAVTAVPANSTSSSYANFLNTIVRIDGDFVVNTSFTIAGSEIRIAPGATITVQNGAILRINNSDLFTCGNLMWKGIVVQPNGTLQLSDNAIIQDAEIAVYSQAGGLVVASNALFNKNYKHFYADAFAGTHPASFTNNVRFYCQSSTNSPGNSLDNNSFGATRTYIGIHADQVNLFNIGSQVGVSNKFDNADIGILSDNSSIEVYNNEFRNMVGPLTMAPPTLPNINVAIEGYSTNGTHTAIIGGSLAKSNKIIDCRRGIFFRNFLNVEVSYNTLFTTYTSPTAPSPPTPIVGETGIAASHSPTFSAFKTTNIHHNDIKDFRTAIYYTPDTQGNMAGNNLNISNNTIEQTFNTIGVTGIYITSFLAPLGQSYANSWIIRQNAIKKVTTGIFVQNILRANGTIRDNVITLKNGSFRNGIRLVNMSRFSIWNNKLFGDGTTVTQINHTGIQVQDCSELSITCNRIFSIGRSMMFLHLNQKLNVFNNRFFGAYDGLVLKDNGIIGQQGYLGNCNFNFNDLPSDNMWIGNFTNSETYTLNTTGANSNSVLIVRTSPPSYLPLINLTNSGANQEYSNAFGGILFSSCPPQATVCPWFFNLPIAPPGGDNMSKIAREQIPYFIFGDTDKWRSKKKVLELIEEDPNLLLNPVLDSFKTANSVSGDYFEWSQIEQLLVNSDWVNAEIANQNIAVNGLPEEYLQEVYRIFININQGESIPNSDINLLETIAATCPLEGGYAVYGARGLLNVYFGNLDMFENTICEDVNQSRSSLANNYRKEEVNIFPNPSKGNFSLANLPEKANTILIKDISGKVIYTKNITTNGSDKIDIDLPNCESGLYFYLIICEGQAPLTGKFIIVK